MAGHESQLTAFQLEIATEFFALPASQGFLLAGGAALLAQRLTNRPTQDMDFFTRPGVGDVRAARDAFQAAMTTRGWTVERVRDGDTFCRLLVHGGEDLLVDIALDSPPTRPATVTVAGPSFAPDELAGRKVVALFDRAAARDFVDVHALQNNFEKDCLLGLAAEVDPGFDRAVFAEMLEHLPRYSDLDLSR